MPDLDGNNSSKHEFNENSHNDEETIFIVDESSKKDMGSDSTVNPFTDKATRTDSNEIVDITSNIVTKSDLIEFGKKMVKDLDKNFSQI